MTAMHHATGTPPAPGSIPILIVEDDLRVGSFMAQGLGDEGYDVTWVKTGPEALPAARRGAPRVILLDFMLPGMSGLEIARAVRRDGLTTPILMITARDAADERAAAQEAGVTDFLAKPFVFDDLVARVGALLAG